MYKLIVVESSYLDANDYALYFDTYEQAKEAEQRIRNKSFHRIDTEITEAQKSCIRPKLK